MKDLPELYVKGISVLLVSLWIGALSTLMLVDSSPQLPTWLGPPHFTSSLILSVVLASVLSSYWPECDNIGWYSAIVACGIVLLLEFIQIFSEVRSVEQKDIIEGVAGAYVGGVFASAIQWRFTSTCLVWLSLTGTFIVVSCIPWLVKDNTPQICHGSIVGNDQWGNVLFDEFSHGFLHATSTNSKKTVSVCTFGGDVLITNDGLRLSGAGMYTISLKGLAEEIRSSGRLTLGVTFKAEDLELTRFPKEIVSLSVGNRFIARVIQNGYSASSTFSGGRWNRTGANMTNRLTGSMQNIVTTYERGTQRTWIDGEMVSVEKNQIDLLSDQEQGEVTLNIGRRSTLHWPPFIGLVNSIYISAS